MPQAPKIIMNASAWYKLRQQSYKGTIKPSENETTFYLGDMPVFIIPEFSDHKPLEDATGYPI